MVKEFQYENEKVKVKVKVVDNNPETRKERLEQAVRKFIKQVEVKQ